MSLVHLNQLTFFGAVASFGHWYLTQEYFCGSFCPSTHNSRKRVCNLHYSTPLSLNIGHLLAINLNCQVFFLERILWIFGKLPNTLTNKPKQLAVEWGSWGGKKSPSTLYSWFSILINKDIASHYTDVLWARIELLVSRNPRNGLIGCSSCKINLIFGNCVSSCPTRRLNYIPLSSHMWCLYMWTGNLWIILIMHIGDQ